MRCRQCRWRLVDCTQELTCQRCHAVYCSTTCQTLGLVHGGCFSVDERALQATILRQTTIKQCQECKTTAQAQVTLLVCGACRAVRYCSTQCQARAWPEHQPHCAVRAVQRRPRRPPRDTVVANPAQECLRQECVILYRCHARGHYVGEAQAGLQMSKAYRDLGYLVRSVQSAAQSITLLTAAKPSVLLTNLHETLGSTLLLMGCFHEAHTVFTHARHSAILRSDLLAEARLYAHVGMLFEANKQWELAKREYLRCHAIVMLVQDDGLQMKVEGLLSSVYCALREYVQAAYHLTLYTKAAIQQQSLEDVGHSYGLYARLALSQQDDDKALVAQHEQLQITIVLGHRLAEARVYGALAQIYLARQQKLVAIEYLHQQLVVTRDMQDIAGEMQAYQLLLPLLDDPGTYQARVDILSKCRRTQAIAIRCVLDTVHILQE